jgi:proline dehydrogenase
MDRLIAEHFVKHDRSTMELIEEFQPHVATAVSVGLTFMGQRTTQAAVNKVYDALEGLIGAAL